MLSALGGLIADLKNDFIKTVYLDLKADALDVIRGEFATLRKRAVSWLKDDQKYDGPPTHLYSAEMRYRGQSFEIDTPLDIGAIERGDLAAVARAFHGEHERLYGHADRDAPLQVISLRLVIIGKTAKPEFPRSPLQPGTANPIRTITARLDGTTRQVALFQRDLLVPGQTFAGPAVVTQDDCTTIVPTGFTVTVDDISNLRINMGSVT